MSLRSPLVGTFVTLSAAQKTVVLLAVFFFIELQFYLFVPSRNVPPAGTIEVSVDERGARPQWFEIAAFNPVTLAVHNECLQPFEYRIEGLMDQPHLLGIHGVDSLPLRLGPGLYRMTILGKERDPAFAVQIEVRR